MHLALIRDTATATYCQGVMHAGALEFQTVERPWIAASPGRGGAHGISCVPPGLYDLVKHDTEAHPRSFALVNPDLDVFHEPADVPVDRLPYARVAILIHVANFPTELAGCIALGMARAPGSVSNSVIALERFRLVVPWVSGHQLEITQAAWH